MRRIELILNPFTCTFLPRHSIVVFPSPSAWFYLRLSHPWQEHHHSFFHLSSSLGKRISQTQSNSHCVIYPHKLTMNPLCQTVSDPVHRPFSLQAHDPSSNAISRPKSKLSREDHRWIWGHLCLEAIFWQDPGQCGRYDHRSRQWPGIKDCLFHYPRLPSFHVGLWFRHKQYWMHHDPTVWVFEWHAQYMYQQKPRYRRDHALPN